MSDFNTIVFTDKHYYVDRYDPNGKEKTVAQLWKDVGDFLRLATQQGYVCKIWDDDSSIIVIEYSIKDEGFGGPYLTWLSDEEADLVDNFRYSTDDYQSNSVPIQNNPTPTQNECESQLAE